MSRRVPSSIRQGRDLQVAANKRNAGDAIAAGRMPFRAVAHDPPEPVFSSLSLCPLFHLQQATARISGDSRAPFSPRSPPTSPGQPLRTHLLLPTVHRLLIILVRLEQQQVNHVQVLDMSVLFKVCSFLHSDHGGGDVECVEGADLRCLSERGEVC